MPYYVYILKCADGTFYTGSTNNLEVRVKHHNLHKSGAKYTRARRPVELIYSANFETNNEARKRENEIKKLTREQKLQLIEKRHSRGNENFSGD